MTLSIPYKAKVNAKRYVELCYPDKLKNASLLPPGFISQQDSAPLPRSHSKVGSLLKTELPPTAVNLLAKMNSHQSRRTLTLFIITSMLEHYKTFHPKPKNTDGLKKVLQLTWEQMPQDSVNETIGCLSYVTLSYHVSIFSLTFISFR